MRRLLPGIALCAVLAAALLAPDGRPESARREAADPTEGPPAPAKRSALSVFSDPEIPPTPLHGFVYDSTGNAVEGAEVVALAGLDSRCCSPRNERRSARTDAAGRFEFPDVRGTVRLVARRGVSGLAQAVATPPGPHLLRFAAESWVEGRVVDPRGHPLAARLKLRVRPRDFPSLRMDGAYELTTGDGTFRFGPVAPGTAVGIEARAEGRRPRRSEVVIVEGASCRVVLAMEPGETLAGVVRSTAGRPLEGVLVEAHQGDGFTHRATTDIDGAFAIAGLDGRPVRVVAGRDGYAAVTESFAHPSQPAVVVLAPVTAVEGRVVPAVADLVAVAVCGDVRHRAAVDAEGRFRIDHVPQGRVRIDIESAGREVKASAWVELSSEIREVIVRMP